ncbi:MAG: phage baseplate protein, partial [Lentisphaerae bacterium]|nr:phage baseplate protein [Lentisphaerota bacterium]
MTGIDKTTGRYLSGLDHLKQSITDILTTPIGSRVMRREYGSRLPRLVDAPLNSSTLVDLYSATAEALQRWEPRFKLTEVTTNTASASAQ